MKKIFLCLLSTLCCGACGGLEIDTADYAGQEDPRIGGFDRTTAYEAMKRSMERDDRVRQILTTLYHDRPDGICGNEDVGQMSAWYVLSALGMYQVKPAGGRRNNG